MNNLNNESSNEPNTNQQFLRRVIDAAVTIGILSILFSWCYLILTPFILPVIWATIIAVALYPLFLKLKPILWNKGGLAAAVIAIIGISVMVIPAVMMSGSLIETIQYLSTGLEQGTLSVPAPGEKVREWPLFGEDIYQIWFSASQNLESVINQYATQIKSVGGRFFSAVAGAGGTILQFIISFLIAAALLTNAEKCHSALVSMATRLMGENGANTVNMSAKTIRSVAQGVLGIAVAQALLAGLGLVVADIPGAALWTLLVLLVAIIQLPPILVLGPIAAYAFSTMDTLPASLFLIWAILVSMSDALLKPLLLGRGVDVPMLVILLGAIGGMIAAGIIGLFIGAVILAITYQLFIDWLTQSSNSSKADDVNISNN